MPSFSPPGYNPNEEHVEVTTPHVNIYLYNMHYEYYIFIDIYTIYIYIYMYVYIHIYIYVYYICNPNEEHVEVTAFAGNLQPYRGTSLIRNSLPLGPYSRIIPRALWKS